MDSAPQKTAEKCATDKTRRCGMEEASNEASWSQSRQAEEGEGLIEGETHRGGRRETERERVRHVGCMAAQAALLYQEAPVGVFPPNSAEKCRAMPTGTSANRAAITSLIELFDSASCCLTAAMLGVEQHRGAEEAPLRALALPPSSLPSRAVIKYGGDVRRRRRHRPHLERWMA